MRILMSLALCLLLTGCEVERKSQQNQSRTVQEKTQKVTPEKDIHQAEWRTVKQGKLNLSQVTYLSEGLKIDALVCAPQNLKAGTPLLMLEHGGFDTETDPRKCNEYAQMGYVIAQSAYRGQGRSEGKVEACLGEVNDSLALKQVVQDRLKTQGVVHVGVSLGGCIALKAAAQQKDVKGVAILVTPMDFAQQIRILRATRPDALSRWFEIFGGTPEEAPEQYEKRRPIAAAPQVNAPILNLIAAQDPLIPYKQQCDLLSVRKKAGKMVEVVHLARNGAPNPPLQQRYVCEGEGKPAFKLPEFKPQDFKNQDVFVTYYDLHHTSTAHMWKTVQDFLRTVAPLP
ncbi:alpha/beta hydrolase family protein [Deinococcus cellulosilyticus]|uniref:Xaa-Pro dipeptidyl-peptidase-like domain-containing protein n=1 Tax=Deinococcus cellulosilyticus (strain DSM 18568 / NBRC 106333 / KACC 11606 / 5516J-15) TaxID=1223518 RepID=A0A511N098_DEIC1|nr:alpha/beta fold hydrolase [Deinococcus cellulosilyticus]GEM45857.1 hypothetical protein DC3_14920 [Deinococcus cellulosilyticus NBRC 106333 = KACC 11606]